MRNFNETIEKLYGYSPLELQRQIARHNSLKEKFKKHFGESAGGSYFSTPGRTELSGNHTDHNHGNVIAGSINLDSLAFVTPNKNFVEIFSDGYENKILVDLSELSPVESEKGTTESLVRGIAAEIQKMGFKISGFKAVIHSEVLRGSGLSSSASIEVLVGEIFNHLYCESKIHPVEIARKGQTAENIYFGKACGLMDQIACAYGGIVAIDFEDNKNPIVENIKISFADFGYSLLVVDTGGSHDNLHEEYSSIPNEMKEVAEFFDETELRKIDPDKFYEELPRLRKIINDRNILRAIHFFNENKRVVKQLEFLKNNNINGFIDLMNGSGNSSFKYLQNVYIHNMKEQCLSLALALTENFINTISKGGCRVHGGGFAGTIQALIPRDQVTYYTETIEKIFGENSVLPLRIREYGTLVYR